MALKPKLKDYFLATIIAIPTAVGAYTMANYGLKEIKKHAPELSKKEAAPILAGISGSFVLMTLPLGVAARRREKEDAKILTEEPKC